MKKILGVIALSVFVGTGAFAQTTTPTFDSVQKAFGDFAGDVASSLPYASTIGLNWSWSYIGKLPHFGVGLAGGAVTIPTKGFSQVTSALGIGNVLPPEFNNPNLGLPLPAYVAEARLGGIILPFDLGIKVGFIPQQVNLGALLPQGTSLDFHLYGAQLRYELVKEKFLIPEISVGVGVNHFDGTIGMSAGTGNIPISSVSDGTNTYNVSLSAPQLFFNWNSNSLDANVQVSKKILLLVTPYIGAGLSYGFSNAGGGLSSKLLINGNPATQTQIDQINQYLNATGQQTINFTTAGFKIGQKANGLSARAYAGASLNLWFLKLDVTGMYNIMTGKLGATVGARAQF